MQPLTFVQLPCLTDNYCVLIHDPATGHTTAIDAPHAGTIKSCLASQGWRLTDLLITHHHNDHTGGCQELLDYYGCTITAPESESERIPGVTRTVREGVTVTIGQIEIRVLDTPGHTLGHVSYYLPKSETVFTGDTLFALGCGRIFEGDAQTMYASLKKIAALPDETTVYCGHEYTLANARFATMVEPENANLAARMKEIESLRAAGKATLPTTIGMEKATNPFIRTQSSAIRARLGMIGAQDWEVFARLREIKNRA